MAPFLASKRSAPVLALVVATTLAGAASTGACSGASDVPAKNGEAGADDCAALEACCAQLTGAVQSTCESDVAAGQSSPDESSCAARLTAYKNEGLCDVDAGPMGTMMGCGGITQPCCEDGVCGAALTCVENVCEVGTSPPSDDGGDDGSSAGGDSGADAQSPVGNGSCPNPTVPIVFSPMYSAFIPGSGHSFQIPATTGDGQYALWGISDPSRASLTPQAFTATRGGVVITITGEGDAGPDASIPPLTVVVTNADGTCGAATLEITANTDTDWTTGQTRYEGDGEDGGVTACIACHGASSSVFKDFARTPEQTGGFSDTDLAGIIAGGTVPDGGYFDPSLINVSCTDAGTTVAPSEPSCFAMAYAEWQAFHKFTDVTPSEMTGLICYLRSFTPESLDGGGDFGGK